LVENNTVLSRLPGDEEWEGEAAAEVVGVFDGAPGVAFGEETTVLNM